MKIYFDHEKLEAYRKSLAFAAWTEPVLERLPKSAAIYNQLDRARTSIVLNIPEGNGRFTPADRCKFFDIARGSALECAGCLDLVFIKKLNLAYSLEDKSNVPVIDKTGLTDRFDFDLNCTDTDLENRNWDKVNLALGKLGLELVPTNMPIEMLVVERAK